MGFARYPDPFGPGAPGRADDMRSWRCLVFALAVALWLPVLSTPAGGVDRIFYLPFACESGERIRGPLILRELWRSLDPLREQSTSYRQGCRLDRDTAASLEKLFQIAGENKVSFPDLVHYAISNANPKCRELDEKANNGEVRRVLACQDDGGWYRAAEVAPPMVVSPTQRMTGAPPSGPPPMPGAAPSGPPPQSNWAPSSPPPNDAPPLQSISRRLQAALNAYGCDAGLPDGIVGPRTRTAIQCAQRKMRHAPTGVLTAEESKQLLEFLGRQAAATQASAPAGAFGPGRNVKFHLGRWERQFEGGSGVEFEITPAQAVVRSKGSRDRRCVQRYNLDPDQSNIDLNRYVRYKASGRHHCAIDQHYFPADTEYLFFKKSWGQVMFWGQNARQMNFVDYYKPMYEVGTQDAAERGDRQCIDRAAARCTFQNCTPSPYTFGSPSCTPYVSKSCFQEEKQKCD